MAQSKALFTGDWQATWVNLPKLRKIRSHILQVCKQQGVGHVVHTGDFKEVLNPVDQRVTNFMVETGRKFRKAGLTFHVLLGNHDRIGMADDTDSCLPVLKAAGARVYDSPGSIDMGGWELYYLPFSSDKQATLDAAASFVEQNPKRDVLIFHDEIKGCRLNAVAKSKSETSLRLNDLNPTQYRYCIGGHIHVMQKLGDNVWYTGSPFSQDWGECNQRKGFLVYDSGTGELTKVWAKVPGFFDPLFPGFEESKPKDWAGTTVRLHLVIDPTGPDYRENLQRVEEQGGRDYPGATILVVPESLERQESTPKRTAGTDEDVIKAYVKANTPEFLRGREKELVAYLLYRLAEIASVSRNNTGLEFLEVEGVNVLSFEKVHYRFRPGITVISGENEALGQRSNGAGKTNFLNLIAVALQGRTVKGQKHNGWRRQRAPEKAQCWVKLTMRLSDGRELMIVRGRKPKGLRIYVDGKPQSAGIGDSGTQKGIEVLTGLTWDVIANGLYIDQGKVNRMLGTDGDRKALLSQFLNLERFERAVKMIRAEALALNYRLEVAATEFSGVEQQLRNTEGFLESFGKVDLEAMRKVAHQLAKTLQDSIDKEAKAEEKRKQFLKTNDIQRVKSQVAGLHGEIGKLAGLVEECDRGLAKLSKLKGTCYVCHGVINTKTIALHKAELKQRKEGLEDTAQKLQKRLQKSLRTLSDLEEERQELEVLWLRAKNETLRLESLGKKYLEDIEKGKVQEETRQKYLGELQGLKKRRKHMRAAERWLQDEATFLKFATRAFSKDGIPAYMIHRLCPRLNAAASYYSKLFVDGQIGVQFKLDKQDIDVQVINPGGGAKTEDQSMGETRTASLVLSFTLRDVMSSCNLLVADEPGEGLDEGGARQFARQLRELTSRFPCILVTSHNPYILSELAGERHTIIKKKNGISHAYRKQD